jgi:osmoprotectant transport system ATP-binding protein
MSEGKLLQYSTPEEILTDPADPFVQQLTGTSGKALKLMAMLPLTSGMEPVRAGLSATLPETLNLRDALSEMIWQGVDEASVRDSSDAPVGSISVRRLLELGKRA